MGKNTLNRILNCVIVILVISIFALIYAISTRPRYEYTSEPESSVLVQASITEETQSSEYRLPAGDVGLQDLEDAGAEGDDGGQADEAAKVQKGKASSKVNIRELPRTDARVMSTIEQGTVFDILEIGTDGWIKVAYNDINGYISSEYVILVKE